MGIKTCLSWLKIMKCCYNKMWDVIKDKLGIKFHGEPVYEYKYLKAKETLMV